MSELWIAGAIFLAIAAAFGIVLKRLLGQDMPAVCKAESLAGFSTARYRPMERLLSDRDYLFLRQQPGYHPDIERRLRRSRRQVFRRYLRDLTREFGRLHRAARFCLIHSAEATPEMHAALLHHRVVFWRARISIEFRLALVGFGVPTENVQALVGGTNGIADLVRQLAAPLPTPHAA